MGKTTKPFKMIDCTRKEFLAMPPNALKIWLYYYLREGAERKAWGSEENICEVTRMNRDTMRKWRGWLEDNGWLKLIGHRDEESGDFAVPVYRVDEGTLPAAESFGYGHSEDSRRKFRTRKPPKVSVTEAAESFGEEVEPKKQVEPAPSASEVEPIKEGKSEGTPAPISQPPAEREKEPRYKPEPDTEETQQVWMVP